MKIKNCCICVLLLCLVLLLTCCSGGGEKDSCLKNGHSFLPADCETASVCSVCGETKGEAQGHSYTEKIIDEEHLKQEATSCSENSTYWYDCSRCDSIAGEDGSAQDKWFVSDIVGSHNVPPDLVSENGEHFRECINEGCDHTEGREACAGGVASCLAKAQCATCGSYYGSLGEHSINTEEWRYCEADGHAHGCRLCDYNEPVIPHIPSADAATEESDITCTECGFIIEERLPHTHSQGTVYEYDSNYHWFDCVKNDGMEYGKSEHSFDNACDTDCNDGCGYTREITHSFTLTKRNESEHWRECSVCNLEQVGSRASHTHVETVTKTPKTFQSGLATYNCSCGDSYEKTLEPTKTLKILGIGNSFAIDAFTHLYIVAKAAGVETIVLGYLHLGGCSLDTHYENMLDNVAVYTFGVSDDTTSKMTNYNGGEKVTAAFALNYADWDYITLQQASQDSGIASTYSNLNNVISYVRQYNDHAELLWHMTWAYQANSTHSGFAAYENNQLTMYNAIVSAVQEKILTNSKIAGVIPNGTTIQNLRNSHLGDNLTRDGYHLTTGIGRYAAALTYLVAVTGYDVSDFSPTGLASDVATHIPCIKEAVASAIAKPYKITPSVNYPYVPPVEEPDDVGALVNLTEEDIAYLTGKGLDATQYKVYEFTYTVNGFYDASRDAQALTTHTTLSPKYIATEIMTKELLTNGSVIRISEGYQYRPEGWVSLDSTIAKSDRPAVVSTETVVIDDSWWGSFNYRGFNISATDNHKMVESEASVLRIYIKTA